MLYEQKALTITKIWFLGGRLPKSYWIQRWFSISSSILMLFKSRTMFNLCASRHQNVCPSIPSSQLYRHEKEYARNPLVWYPTSHIFLTFSSYDEPFRHLLSRIDGSYHQKWRNWKNTRPWPPLWDLKLIIQNQVPSVFFHILRNVRIGIAEKIHIMIAEKKISFPNNFIFN